VLSLMGAELAAVCDIDLECAETLAAGTGARTYRTGVTCSTAGPGALVVLPAQVHRDPAVAALNRGCPCTWRNRSPAPSRTPRPS
jgi:predicted dehydrogenase